jgi:hypothetical protein
MRAFEAVRLSQVSGNLFPMLSLTLASIPRADPCQCHLGEIPSRYTWVIYGHTTQDPSGQGASHPKHAPFLKEIIV